MTVLMLKNATYYTKYDKLYKPIYPFRNLIQVLNLYYNLLYIACTVISRCITCMYAYQIQIITHAGNAIWYGIMKSARLSIIPL